MRRVKFIDKYTIRYPQPLEKYGGVWVSNFDLSDDEVLVAAGYNKWFDPASSSPPTVLDVWVPTYVIDGDNVVYGEWERQTREPDLVETILLNDLMEGNYSKYKASVLYTHADIIPAWHPEGVYGTDIVVREADKLWVSLHPMLTPAQNTRPSENPQMWLEVAEGIGDWREWIQPIGTVGLYMLGAKVTHNNQKWVSKLDYNGHEPSAAAYAAWDLFEEDTPPDEDEDEEPTPYQAWAQPVGSEDAYPFGAIVTHNDETWISDVANNVWEPGVYGWEIYVG